MSATYHVTVQDQPTTALLGTRVNISVILQNFFDSLTQKPKLLKSPNQTVMSASGAHLGPIGQCHLTFRLGNKCLTDKFIVLKDLQRNLNLGLNWQSHYKIGCNWNIIGQQYITYNWYLYTSITSTATKPTIHHAGAFYLQPRSMSVLTVQNTN